MFYLRCFALCGILLCFSKNVIALNQNAPASIPPLMNFQGRIATPEGNPVPDGSYSIAFRLYDAPSAGQLLWEETIPAVIVRNGVFAVIWGNIQPLSETVFEHDAYLEIQIGSDTPLLPVSAL